MFTQIVNCLQTCENVSAHWAIKVYVFVKFHNTYLLRCLKKHLKLAVGVCCCLQTCNSVVNVLLMGLVPRQSFMSILLYAKVSPLYNVIWECNVVVYMLITMFTDISTYECTLGHQSLGVCEIFISQSTVVLCI